MAYLGRPSGGDSPFAIGDRAMRDTSSPQPPSQRNPTPRRSPVPPAVGSMQAPSPYGSVSDEARRRYEERYAKKKAEEAAKAEAERQQQGMGGGSAAGGSMGPPPAPPQQYGGPPQQQHHGGPPSHHLGPPAHQGGPPPQQGFRSPPPQAFQQHQQQQQQQQGRPFSPHDPRQSQGFPPPNQSPYPPHQQQQQHLQQPPPGQRPPSLQQAPGGYQSPPPPQQRWSNPTPHPPPQNQHQPGPAQPQWSANAPPPPSQQWREPPPPASQPRVEDQELHNLFSQFDSSRSGQLNSYDLQRLLAKDATMDAREDCVKMLMNIFDTDKSGSINFMEFEGLYRYIQDWHGIFLRFDRDGSGLIDRKELHQALLGFGFSLPSDMVRKLEKRFAPPPKPGHAPSGGISFDRFLMACVTVKHFTEAFRRMDSRGEGRLTMDYNQFMDLVLDSPS